MADLQPFPPRPQAKRESGDGLPAKPHAQLFMDARVGAAYRLTESVPGGMYNGAGLVLLTQVSVGWVLKSRGDKSLL